MMGRWANGCGYEGGFKRGVYDGMGTFTWQDNATYKGNWKDGKRHGSGIYVRADGVDTYDGDWQHDVKHGQGFQQLSDGRTFEGAYTEGLPGFGVLTLQGAACACCHGRLQTAALLPLCASSHKHVCSADPCEGMRVRSLVGLRGLGVRACVRRAARDVECPPAPRASGCAA
jgi:hypothetical protein